MATVKIGFSGLSVPDQVERGRKIVTNMTGNPDFVTPNPTLVVAGASTDAAELAYNESRGRDKNKLAVLRLRRAEMLFIFKQLGAYVQEASGGDEEKILSTGYDVRSSSINHHSDTAGQVTNVQLSDGTISGKVEVTWDKADNAVIYLIESASSISFADSEFKGCSTKSHKEIGMYNPGSTVWIRVFALGRENPGSHSTPVSILVR